MKLYDCDCGGIPLSATTNEGIGWYFVFCPKCGSSTPDYDYEGDALRMWNLWCCKSAYKDKKFDVQDI